MDFRNQLETKLTNIRINETSVTIEFDLTSPTGVFSKSVEASRLYSIPTYNQTHLRSIDVDQETYFLEDHKANGISAIKVSSVFFL